MRAAEDQHFHFRIGQLGFQIVKIDRIYTFLIDQTAGHRRASAGFNRLFKRIVDRREDRDLLTRLYERADGDVDSRDDARKQNQPILFDCPMMAALHPVHRFRVVIFTGVGIA